MWTLYNLLITLTSPLWMPWMLWRTHRRGEKPNWKERQGDYREAIPKKAERPRLWIHTVSVGEFFAAQPLLRELRKQFPNHELVVSVTTSSGHQAARESEAGLYDYLVYLPIDVPRFALPAMQRVRPDALIVLETELWMNLFWAADTFDVKTYVVNARLSDRSYPRAKQIRFFYSALLKMVGKILAQSDTDAERFRELGATNVETSGNLKFDQALAGLENDSVDWRSELNLEPGKPVVVVGSLRAEEFEEIAEVVAGNRLVQWIIAPRHLERKEELVKALATASLLQESPLEIGYRSDKTGGEAIILDSYGELASVYSVADVAIVGGSFKKIGMQNMIQPLAHGKPVLHGPFTQNFRDVADMALRAGASEVCESGTDLGVKLAELIGDAERREKMGEAAAWLVQANRGAAVRMVKQIADELATVQVGSKRG